MVETEPSLRQIEGKATEEIINLLADSRSSAGVQSRLRSEWTHRVEIVWFFGRNCGRSVCRSRRSRCILR